MTVDLAQPAELLDAILSLDLTQCDLAVCIAAGEPAPKEFTFRRIVQTSNLEQQFRGAIDEALKGYRQKLDEGNIELHDFAAEADKPAQEIEYLNILPFDSIKNQIKPIENYMDLSHFEHAERNFTSKMRFYVIRVQPRVGGAPIYFYRQYFPSQMLSEAPIFAMLWLQRGLYDDLTEPTFLFDRHIDCFSCEEHMFILQKQNFFKIFDFSELRKLAQETLEILDKKDFIQNFSRFKADCLTDKNKILKLRNIANRTYLSTLTIDDLHKTIRTYDLPIQVDIVGGKKKLVYDPRKRWAILHVLDDAYANSPMTKNSYYLKGKREIRRK